MIRTIWLFDPKRKSTNFIIAKFLAGIYNDIVQDFGRAQTMFEIYSAWLRDTLKFSHDTRAVTALEYGLIAALIAVAIIGAVSTLGQNLSNTFNGIANHFGWNGVNR